MLEKFKAIGEKLYDLMDEDEKAVVAYGMVPIETMNIITEELRTLIAKREMKRFEIEEDDSEALEMFRGAVKKEIISEFQKQTHIAILEAAKKAGNLLV